MIMLNGVPVQWRSRLQNEVSVSSAVAEIYALYDTVREANEFVWRCEEMGVNGVNFPVKVNVDNKQCITFSQNTCLTLTQAKNSLR